MRTRIFLKAVGTLAAASVLATVRLILAQAQSAHSTTCSAKKLIRIAIPTDFPPYGFVGTDLQAAGPGHRHGQLIGAKLGVKVELVPVTSANRIPYLQTKKADLVISTLGKNPEREKVIDFTAAYSPFFQAVFGAEERWPSRRRRPRRQDGRRDARRDRGPGARPRSRRPAPTSSASRTTTPRSRPSSRARCR